MAYIYDETNNTFTGVTWTNPVNGGPGGASAPITVTQDGVISAASGEALVLAGGDYAVTVNGIVSASSGAANAGIFYHKGGSLTVGATGYVFGSGRAVWAVEALTIKNAGRIEGTAGILIGGGAEDFSISNSGIMGATTTDLSSVLGIAVTGTGKHTITNTGTILGDIGNLTFTTGDTGFEIINNSGLITGQLQLDADADSLTNKGTIQGLVDLGSGADKLTNSGLIDDNVIAGDDADSLSNSGIITGTMDAGSGADKLANKGLINGLIKMGADNDIFTGGNFAENLVDEGGMDSYKLAGGDDTFNAIGSGSADGFIDIIDGGASGALNFALGKLGDAYKVFDVANTLAGTANVVINLDAKTQVNLLDNSLHGGGTAEGTQIGTDLLKGFESVFSGDGADVIFGNAGANLIYGGKGGDVIFGLAGNDWISGDAEDDYIFGGEGADRLAGGTDTIVDRFYYTSVKDSTVALAGRDTITDFEGAYDYINFSKMTDAALHMNTTLVDAAFDGSAGAVRVLTTQDGYVVQVDTNGDRKVDMAIDIMDADHSNASWWGASFEF